MNFEYCLLNERHNYFLTHVGEKCICLHNGAEQRDLCTGEN